MIGRRILVVAAHPDDEVLGCGGLLAKSRAEGKDCLALILGEGSTCRFATADTTPPEVAAAVAERQDAAQTAAKILGGVELVFHDLPCGRFDQIPLIEIGKRIEREIAKFDPDTVLTHSRKDVNNDHRISFQATLQATRPGAQNHVHSVLTYEVLSSSEWAFVEQFQPQLFVQIDDFIERKVAAMNAYAKEQRPYPFPRSAEGLRTHAMMRGMQVAARFAEAFEVVRSMVR